VRATSYRFKSCYPHHRRSKLYIACSDFFTKIRAHSRRCSSFPQKVTLGYVVRLKTPSRRFAVATNFCGSSPYRNLTPVFCYTLTRDNLFCLTRQERFLSCSQKFNRLKYGKTPTKQGRNARRNRAGSFLFSGGIKLVAFGGPLPGKENVKTATDGILILTVFPASPKDKTERLNLGLMCTIM
jgi:hypothetical protein